MFDFLVECCGSDAEPSVTPLVSLVRPSGTFAANSSFFCVKQILSTLTFVLPRTGRVAMRVAAMDAERVQRGEPPFLAACVIEDMDLVWRAMFGVFASAFLAAVGIQY